MDRDEKQISAGGLRSANQCATIATRAGYVRLVHPVTQRFVAEYDPERGLLRVSDGGRVATIDLNGVRIAF